MRTNRPYPTRVACAMLAGLLVLSIDGQLSADTRSGAEASDPAAMDQTVKVRLTFRDEPVDEPMLAFIAEATGKVVLPAGPVALKTRKITAITASPVPRDEAIDVLFRAMRVNDIGVIERETDIIIGMLPEIASLRLLPVSPADESVLDRQDTGTLVLKIFQLHGASASDVFDHLSGSLPQAAAQLSVDTGSNQLLLAADVGLCQHVERLLEELDRHASATVRVFMLRFANAVQVADTLNDLFGERSVTTRTTRARPGPPHVSPPGLIGFRRVVPYPAANMVLALGNREAIELIDVTIAEMDAPTDLGVPFVMELEHAEAKEIASELNLLLAPAGVDGVTPGGPQVPDANARFPWMRDGGDAPDPGLENLLTGRVRVVPLGRRNALAILCPAPQREAMRDFVRSLDRREAPTP